MPCKVPDQCSVVCTVGSYTAGKRWGGVAAPHTFKQPLRLPWLDYALETAWPWGPGWAVKTKRPPFFYHI